MNLHVIAAVVCLVLWIYLAFIAAIPAGWVHAPLIIAVVLIARGIVVGKAK
jgi:uncharacterized membrane protein (DUF485 family)